jgi:hypothetical protein
MDTSIAIRNKGLVQRSKSKRSMQNLRKLGITQQRYSAQGERRQERTRTINNKPRERYKKSQAKKGKGRRRRR